MNSSAEIREIRSLPTLHPSWLVALCITIIVAISIFDTYMVVKYRHVILEGERNPICEVLIRQDPIKLSWFVTAKMLGNLGVVACLTSLYRFGYPHCLLVAKWITTFQIALFAYLNLSDPMTGFLHFDDLFRPSYHQAKAIISLLKHLTGLCLLILAYGFFRRMALRRI